MFNFFLITFSAVPQASGLERLRVPREWAILLQFDVMDGFR